MNDYLRRLCIDPPRVRKEASDKRKERSRSKGVVPLNIYSRQKAASKKRGHSQPSYSKKWLVNWMLSNPEYHRMYDIWELSGYDRDLVPTVDRIDDSIGYTEYNIQLLDWKSNRAKGHIERTIGNQNTSQGKISRPISAIRIIDNKKFEFKSITEASRATGSSKGNIDMCLSDSYSRKKSKGFSNWRYIDV